MATSGTMTKNEAGWQFSDQIKGSGNYKASLPTENKFVDANINVTLNVPAASAPTLELTDKTTALDMGTAVNGVYKPTIDLAGNVNIATAGWITAGNKEVTDSSVVVGNVNQSVMTLGSQSIATGETITPNDAIQILTISEGYNAARTLLVGSVDMGPLAEVTSGAATVTISTPTWDSTNSRFEQTASGSIAIPTIVTPGFISTEKGVKNGNTINVGKALDTIAIRAAATGSYTVTPTLTRVERTSIDASWEDASSGEGTILEPGSGAYVKVAASAQTSQLQLSTAVDSEGYGTSAHFTDNSTSITIGSNDADALYVPIKSGSITVNGVSINSISVASGQGGFIISGSEQLPAPTINDAGYISDNVGSIARGSAQVEATLDTIGLGVNVSSSYSTEQYIYPEIHINTTFPYKRINAGEITDNPDSFSSPYAVVFNIDSELRDYEISPTVTQAGYGTTEQFNGPSAPTNIRVGVSGIGDYFIPIPATSFNNAADASTESAGGYTDISDNVSPIPSGGYLYIEEGYTSPVKISLAKLVPDASDANAPTQYILSGYTAYDNDGNLIVGTMQTYDGSYTIL